MPIVKAIICGRERENPRYYKKRHDIDNAFHVYLPKGMRLIYSITNYQGKKTPFQMTSFLLLWIIF